MKRLALLFLVLSALCHPAYATITIVQNAGCNAVSTSVTCTYGSTPIDNNLLVGVIFTKSDTAPTKPTGWTQAIQVKNSTNNDYLEIDYRVASSSGTSVQWTSMDASSAIGAHIYEVSGLDTASVLDKTASTAWVSTSVATVSSGTTSTTSQADEFAIAAAGIRALVSVPTCDTSFINPTADTANDGSGGGSLVACNRILSSTGTYSTNLGWTTNGSAMAAIATFQFTAGIAIDSATNSTYKTASSSYNTTVTCSGANRYLVAGVSMLSVAGSSVTSITHNGTNLVFLGAVASISGAVRAELWGLAAPATGAQTVTVTLSAALDSASGFICFTGVHQTSSTEGFNSATATNVGAADATVNVTTIADNDMVVDQVASDDTAITVGAGQTSRNNVTGTLGSGADSTEGPKTPAGSVTMSWTNVGAAQTWSIAAIALRPIAASGSSHRLPLLNNGS